MHDRGVSVDYSTINRRILLKYALQLEPEFRKT
jgi:hypothetical protein